MSRKTARNAVLGTLVSGALLAASAPAWAFNYYEMEVYPYRTAAKGELELENSTAYTALGTKEDGENDNLLRNSPELSYGLTSHWEVAAYGDFNYDTGTGESHYAGSRFRVRTRFFEKGELPVDLGLYAELEMPKHDEDTQELDLKAIIEKDFGRWTIDLNPALEKVLKGENSSQNWVFHYAAAAIYRLNERWQPRLEFFGETGPIDNPDPADEQVHMISPAVDFRVTPFFKVRAGVAFGLTDGSEQRLVRTNLEYEWY